MSKTILITGCSSGIGKATARYFHSKGWNVIATMRNPSAERELKEDERMKIIRIDVQDKLSIRDGIADGLRHYSTIDVLVNNAGYGAYGPVEAAEDDEIRKQYDVNFFGVIDCIKEILPHFKKKKSGLIINITSVGGLMTLPLYGVYNSSKFALEGLSEGMWFDLKPFGIGVKVIEPGGIKTDFAGRSLQEFDLTDFPEYKSYNDKMIGKFRDPKFTANFGTPESVAEVIYSAATDGSDRLRYLVGKDAKSFWFIRRWFGYRFQMKQVLKYFGL